MSRYKYQLSAYMRGTQINLHLSCTDLRGLTVPDETSLACPTLPLTEQKFGVNVRRGCVKSGVYSMAIYSILHYLSCTSQTPTSASCFLVVVDPQQVDPSTDISFVRVDQLVLLQCCPSLLCKKGEVSHVLAVPNCCMSSILLISGLYCF